MRKFLNLFIPRTIKSQMVIMISIVVVLQILVTVAIFQSHIADYYEDYIGSRVMGIAKTVARMHTVREALAEDIPVRDVQKLAESVREDTGAEFVVVGRPDGTRLSHPNPENIGKTFVGGDFRRAIEDGISYVSESVGTLGPSLRGFSPVKNADGRIIGFVSVGYLKTDVDREIFLAQRKPATYVFMMVFIGLVSAVIIAGYVKRITLDLEPSEIASMHKEREIILNSVREGIIAVDCTGRIRFANNEAGRILHLENDINRKDINEIMPDSIITKRLLNCEEGHDEEIRTGEDTLIFNITPVYSRSRVEGVVASFRRRDEIDYIKRELNTVKECSEMLRVQSHEYSNKLHTISGLLQIEEYEEAKDIILKESEGYHSLVEYLDNSVNCTLISGTVIGKYNRACELKCEFELYRDGGWPAPPASPDDAVTILGNLLDNAMEAARNSEKPWIKLSLYTDDDMLAALVEDNGPGLNPENNIFAKGYTTKGDGHGIGLYNVVMALENAEGRIEAGNRDEGGAYFRIFLPAAEEIIEEQEA
ncbi:ATP-binding protein [Limisalsivibrio acetivorans]|uniref:ATP-binding protein n=1 Tax=Limisalsivibrio acetivorans TaxID=1304888 RepID=UPI0003B4BF49|nr:sensor histidine kinase [Limisalsivibrio acetivorans]